MRCKGESMQEWECMGKTGFIWSQKKKGEWHDSTLIVQMIFIAMHQQLHEYLSSDYYSYSSAQHLLIDNQSSHSDVRNQLIEFQLI